MVSSDKKNLSAFIHTKAGALGFDLCGIARSRSLAEHEKPIREWCSSWMNSDIDYIYIQLGKRINPEFLLPGTRSVIVTGLSYFSDKLQGGPGIPVISRYAYGKDYHGIIKSKLDELLECVIHYYPGTNGKSFVDTAPLLEKAWGREAGIGWPGKHSILINDKIGSFFFIGIILLNRELDYDIPYTGENCGSCRLCLDACPTGAINDNRTIDTRKCIAYLTIESKKPVPSELASKMEGRVFGCDRCQEVCPWNRHAIKCNVPEFQISSELREMTHSEWQNLSRVRFKKLFKGSVIGRKKYGTFVENVALVTR